MASEGIKRKKSEQNENEEGESASEDGDDLDLGDIADGIEREEREMDEGGAESKDGDELAEDEVERFERALGGKVDELAPSVKPARLVLTKVSVNA